MIIEKKNVIRWRTWYGLTAVIEIYNRSIHRAGFGKILIPHPPAVNWLLRLGLSNDSYYKLSKIHEFGHFQTLPIIFVYFAAAGWWIITGCQTTLFGIVALVMSILAMAEILAEAYVRFNTGSLYAQHYKGISIFPRLLFWVATIAISVAGWVVVLW